MLVVGNLAFVASVFAPPEWSDDLYSRGRWHFDGWQTIALVSVLADIVAALARPTAVVLCTICFAHSCYREASNQAMQRTASKAAIAFCVFAIHALAAWHAFPGSRSLILCLVRRLTVARDANIR